MTPEEIDAYISRKADEFMTRIDGTAELEWCGPGGTLEQGIKELVREVMRDMTIHLSHATQDERARWAAGS